MFRLGLFLLFASSLLQAQEVLFLDLTGVSQRTELRSPPEPTRTEKQGSGVEGGFGSVLIADGAPDIRDPHALAVYLEHVTPSSINPAEPFEVELKVLNSGLATIAVPISPHLADLQPADDSVPFTYLSIGLHIDSINADHQGPQIYAIADVELYGSSEHEGTVLDLKPGEWVRVRADVRLSMWPSEAATVRMASTFLLREITYMPHPGGSSRKIVNRYANQTPTPWTEPIHILSFKRTHK